MCVYGLIDVFPVRLPPPCLPSPRDSLHPPIPSPRLVSKENLLQCQKRPITVPKETYYSACTRKSLLPAFRSLLVSLQSVVLNTHTHTHTHSHKHTHAHTLAHTRTHAHTRTRTRTHAQTHSHTHTPTSSGPPGTVRKLGTHGNDVTDCEYAPRGVDRYVYFYVVLLYMAVISYPFTH